MKKSKEFIVRRYSSAGSLYLEFLNGTEATCLCYRAFVRAFGIKVGIGEKKRVKITIEEIK